MRASALCGKRSPNHDEEDNDDDHAENYDGDDEVDYQGRFACHTSAWERTRKCQRSQARLFSTFNLSGF